ncbi:hypothetical protein [Tenacibaculum maritimum]|uniref:hypothetical protein n=1 Tax=Tenacibaculum maritimum TaxID=107401 RepID=UPI0012E5DEF4|nr:hypothetical protein [Tenacibaculum maritimum]CAA0254647.1 conserved hypothetical protein [Tenacibaculum maritimum]
MIKHYNAHIAISNTMLKLSYRSGKFYKAEKINGKLSVKQIEKLGAIIPPTEADFGGYNVRFDGKVTYSIIVKDKSTYQLFNDAWHAFYHELMKVKPRFNKAEGASLKGIIKYLSEIGGNEAKGFELWQVILSSWDALDEFHKKNPDLKYINGNIMRIYENVKRINDTEKGTVSNDYLERVMRDLQS